MADRETPPAGPPAEPDRQLQSSDSPARGRAEGEGVEQAKRSPMRPFTARERVVRAELEVGHAGTSRGRPLPLATPQAEAPLGPVSGQRGEVSSLTDTPLPPHPAKVRPAGAAAAAAPGPAPGVPPQRNNEASVEAAPSLPAGLAKLPILGTPFPWFETVPPPTGPVGGRSPGGAVAWITNSRVSLGVALAGGAAAVGLGLAVGRLSAPNAELPAPSAQGAVAEASASVTPSPPPPTLEERAREGDTAALERLAELPRERRSVEQGLALADGRAVARSSEIEALRDRIAREPTVVDDREVHKQLLEFAGDQQTWRLALEVIAELPGHWSADLLYEIWTGTPARTEATKLAEALVYAHTVRKKATPALAVALELRASKPEDCEGRKRILERAVEVGDNRSLHLVTRLMRRYGCGPSLKKDCNACLRGEDIVIDAVRATRDREGPKL